MSYQPFKTRCAICRALVLVDDLDAHEAWHRILSNIPDPELPEVTLR